MGKAEQQVESEEVERILLVEDDPGLQRQMHWALAPYETIVASSRAEALRQFKLQGPFKTVILDLGLPPDENGVTEGLKTLDEILSLEPQTKVIIASGQTDRTSAVKARREQIASANRRSKHPRFCFRLVEDGPGPPDHRQSRPRRRQRAHLRRNRHGQGSCGKGAARRIGPAQCAFCCHQLRLNSGESSRKRAIRS